MNRRKRNALIVGVAFSLLAGAAILVVVGVLSEVSPENGLMSPVAPPVQEKPEAPLSPEVAAVSPQAVTRPEPTRDNARRIWAPVLVPATAPMAYPLGRVRLGRPERTRISPWYEENRLIVHSVAIRPAGRGTQIFGKVIVDFDCDRPPAGSNLATGPIRGLKVDLKLYEMSSLLERDPNGKPQAPRVDPKTWGRAVEGQCVQCAPGQQLAGFLQGTFDFPVLPAALAPGAYVLVATLQFTSQTATQLQQIKYCSDFWGADDKGINPANGQRILEPVMEYPSRHEKFFRQVVEDMKRIEASAKIYMGDARGLSGAAPNLVVLDQLTDRIADVEFLAAQREEKQAPRDFQNIEDWIVLYGGPANNEEFRYREANLTALPGVLEQIAQFQEYLRLRYWVLLDGYLHYGWHTVNRPGNNVFNAVDTNAADDVKKRVDQLAANRKTYGEDLKAYDAAFRAKLKYYPPEVAEIALKYKTRSERTNDFDSGRFTKFRGDDITLDFEKWYEFRDEWMKSFIKQTDELLHELDTFNVFGNTLMPTLLEEARAQRDEVVCNPFAYEFWTRTKTGRREAAENVLADWAVLDGVDPQRGLRRYIDQSQCAPGAVLARYNAHLAVIRDGLKLGRFSDDYKQAVEGGIPVRPGEAWPRK